MIVSPVKDNMLVIDNYLNSEEHKLIKETLLGDFPWYYNDYKVGDEAIDDKYNYQLIHMFYNDYTITSQYWQTILPIIKKLNPAAIVRVKANLNPNTDNPNVFAFHTDTNIRFKGKTAVYYVNTNNGYTIFKNGKEVESVENRIVIFDNNELHTNSTCTDKKVRCVLNFNYIEQERDVDNND
jgi:hypothetical protein